MVSLSADLPLILVGGKAAALTKMIQAGFDVPSGFVITTESHANMSTSLKKAVLKSFDELGSPYVAVRSSAVAEDGKEAAWAGQMDTFLNVDKDNLIKAVIGCWDSAYSERAKAYAKEHNLKTGSVAVVIQTMLQSDTSGITFSINPITKNTNEMIIEAGLGLNEPIVSGEITPDTYVVNSVSMEITQKHISNQTKKLTQSKSGKNYWKMTSNGNKQKLSDEQVVKVAKTIAELEKYFGFPVDVEWTFVNQNLYILQSRPITTLG